jgi:hypothetical protein
MNAWSIPLSCLGIFAVSAWAQDAPSPPKPTPTPRQACQADYQKFCSGVPRGGGHILECLNSHKGELTTACQEALLKAAPQNTGGEEPPSKPPQ